MLHLTLIIAYPYNLLGIGTEDHGRIKRKLFLVHPVGQSIDDFVELTVLGHLTLGIVIKQFHEKDVIVADESYLVSVGTPHGNLLWTAVAQGHQSVVGHVEDIIHSRERVAIDALCFGLNKHVTPIGTHHIAIHTLNLRASCRIHVEEHARLLARFKRVLHYLLAVRRNLCIAFAIAQGFHTHHRFCSEGTVCNILYCQLLACQHRCGSRQ